MKKGDLIFVYGTLMEGQSNGLDKWDGVRYVGLDGVRGKLYNLGWYPGARDVVNDCSAEPFVGYIEGEVFEILEENIVDALDSYEGYPSLYDRKQVVSHAGRTVWVYTYNGEPEEEKLIPSGDWRAHSYDLAQGVRRIDVV